jgi:hypothetical protein
MDGNDTGYEGVGWIYLVVGFCEHGNEQYYLLEFDVVCVVEFTDVSEERTAPIIRV